MSDKPPIKAARSYSDGKVAINGLVNSGGYNPSVLTKFSLNISADEARTLAAKLIVLADEADANVAKKAAADARRSKWRDQEIAAGRMRVMSAREFLR